MKLQFKHQKFQEDAARAVVEVFIGQACATQNYLVDSKLEKSGQIKILAETFGTEIKPIREGKL